MPTNYLSGVFGPSVLKPLQDHMAVSVECVNLLTPLVEALNKADIVTAESIQQQIIQLEQEADKQKTSLRKQLGLSLLLPIPRRDLLEVIRLQDKIANKARDLAGLMIGRKMVFPEALQTDYASFLDSCQQSCLQAQICIKELDELLETGFGGKMVDLMSNFLQRLDDVESLTDELKRQLETKLMALEDQVHPVQVMFMYRAITLTANLADQANRLGNALQSQISR